MTAENVKFPVAIIHYSAPPAPGEAGRVVAGHARSLARAGYPVRLVVGAGAAPSADVDLRRVPELSPAHPRTLEVNSALLRGEEPEEFESCVLDVAQGIGRELVGCGTVFVHDLLTTPWNLAATEAIRRLEKGSRGPGIPGSPTRRWVAWAGRLETAGASAGRKKHPTSLVTSPLPNARYVAPSEPGRTAVAKALGLAKRVVEVVPGGVDVADCLGLTANVRRLAEEAELFAADAILFSAVAAAEGCGLERGLEIVKAMTRAKRGLALRWIVTAEPDPRRASSAGVLAELIARRDKLGLGEVVRFLSAECDWAHGGVSTEDLSALHRLADAVVLTGTDNASGLAALEGSLVGSRVVVESTVSLRELVKGEKGVVVLAPRAKPAAAAKRILAALESAPAAGLKGLARRSLTWDAIARDFLVPLVEGGKIAAKAKRR